MPRFGIDFDVRHYNGSIIIEAASRKEAAERFDKIDLNVLMEHTGAVATEIEQIVDLDALMIED